MNQLTRKLTRKLCSLLLAAVMLFSLSVNMVRAADQAPPAEIQDCTVDNRVITLKFSDSDSAWVRAINKVVIDGQNYESTYMISWVSGNYYNAGSIMGAYGSYDGLQIIKNFDNEATCVISASGYEDLTVKLAMSGNSCTAEIQGSGGPTEPATYTVTVAETTHGSISAAPAQAAEGDTVTVTAAPENGYELDTLTVAQSNGSTVSTTATDTGCTFTMPAGDVTVSAIFQKKSSSGGPDSGSAKTISISQIDITDDSSGFFLASYASYWYFTFENAPDYISAITALSVNGTPWEAKTFSPSAGGVYYPDTGNDRLTFSINNYSSSGPGTLKSGDVITIQATGYEDLTFKFLLDADGKNPHAAEDDGQGDPYKLHVKLVGSFEAAIVGQKDYDGVSGATGAVSSNKNSSVTVYGALLEKGREPEADDWKELDSYSSGISIDGSKCHVDIVPDTAKGTSETADSGMEGVYLTISSALTLSGTPKDAGSYLISITVADDQGRTATSNALPFLIYTGEETLADRLVTENLKQTQDGKYMWDIMEPWAIKNFGSNVDGEENSVRVPQGLKAWYGSHESGTYGYLGYDLAWSEVMKGDIPQTLYIPSGCDLTMINMEILSSVRIVVEDGGKLTLRDSVVQGIIDVKSGGTFSMNYNNTTGEFLTGASICGQLRLEDGAVLENAAIYSHYNYLANGDLTDRSGSDPVVTATGNVTAKGQVFIRGDDAASDIGQAALRVSGTLTLEDQAVLAAYGGDGKTPIYAKGGDAIQLENGSTITGSGKVIAIGGAALFGDGGDACSGSGTISTSEAFLRGATAYGSSTPGKALTGSIAATSPVRSVEDGVQVEMGKDDPIEDLYWKSGISAAPSLEQYQISTPVTFAVTANVSAGAGGRVTVDQQTAAEGDIITVTVTPDSGYVLSSLTAAAASGGSVSITKTAAGYAFTMPASDVTVTAAFANSASGSTGGSGSSGSSSSYAVSVDSVKNGSVTVSSKRASKGSVITITVKPNDGYELDELIVLDKNGDELKLAKKSGTKYTFTMPASKVTVEAVFAKVQSSAASAFYDVSADAYYYDAVQWAVEQGITGGTGAGMFSPDTACTRAQIVTFLWRAAGSPKVSGSHPFTDLQAGAYYYDAVLWAVSEGITGGTTATTFSPDAPVSRAQTVTFLWRAKGAPAAGGSTFADVPSDAYYTGAVAWAVRESITTGTAAGRFSPDAACTRAQIVTFLYRDRAE